MDKQFILATVFGLAFCAFTSTEAQALSECSRSAPGTPTEEECKCNAIGRGVSCITLGDHAMCGDNHEIEVCRYTAEIGCKCEVIKDPKFDFPKQ